MDALSSINNVAAKAYAAASPSNYALAGPNPASPTAIQEMGAVGDLKGAGSGGHGFGDVVSKFVSEVDQKQKIAGDAVQGLLSGQNVPLHKAVIAAEEANVSFQLMVEVRNKLLESYQEV